MPIQVNGTAITPFNIKDMNLESQTVKVDKSQEKVFNFLSEIKNFEKLMPNNINKFEVLGEDKFLFALKKMPEIVLKKKELIAPNKIVLKTANGKIDFSLTNLITKTK